MQTITTGARIYDSTARDFLDAKHQRLAEILYDYKPSLSLEYVPSMDRDETDTKPFRIKDTPTNGDKPYIVRYLNEREMADPAQILEWVWEGDFRKHNPDAIFDRLEARRIAREALEKKTELEEREEQIELMSTLATGGRDRKNFFRHNGTTFHR